MWPATTRGYGTWPGYGPSASELCPPNSPNATLPVSNALYPTLLLALALAACATDTDTVDGLTRDGLPADVAPPDPPGEAYYVRATTVGAGAPAPKADVISATGTVVNEKEARPSFKTGGLLTAVRVEAGDAVRRGQTIATVDATELNAGRAQAEAGLEKARRDLQRVEALFVDSVATRAQRDDAATAVRVAERQLERIAFNTGTTAIASPISGRVVAKLANAGETVGPGQPVVFIQGTQRADWRVRAALTDGEWARTRKGQRATVTFEAYPGQSFPARLTERAAVANPSGGTFDVEFRLDKQPRDLAAGLLARVEIAAGEAGEAEPALSLAERAKTRDAAAVPLRIPLTALARVNGKRAEVYTVDEDGRAAMKTVRLGDFDGTSAEVVEGLAAGEQVVTTGATWLREGDRIVVK